MTSQKSKVMPQPENKKKKGRAKLNLLLNRRYKPITLLIVIIILLLGYFFFIQPQIKKLRESARSTLPAKSLELTSLKSYEKKIDELESLVKSFQTKYQKQLNDLEQVLPVQSQLPELIAQLDALAKKSGFSITALDISESALAEKPSKNRDKKEAALEPDTKDQASLENLKLLSVHLNLSGGDYPAFKVLLDKIEKHIRLLDVESIKFKSAGEKVEYNLNLRTYYFAVKL